MREDSTGEPAGDSRFTVEERLGAGSAGVVYTAYDHRRGERVAMKALNTRNASALYRFKREFRTLADVVHRNLVALYELVADDDDPFYTMELVDGVDFLEYVRPGGEKAGGFDEERLRATLPQLAAGIKVLHDADKIHCDLKPTNVLVDGDGRVVILDFGISRDLAPPLTPMSVQQGLAGTVLYMAPEQCRGVDASPSSDWYAFGVMLFQALTGKLPFDGSLVEVLTAKTERRPPSARDAAEGLPEDLVTLADDLLSPSPESRPLGAEVLLRLGKKDKVTDTTVELSFGPGTHSFIGRQKELAELRDAFARSCDGQATAVYVHGESGLGKTAFVEAFLRDLVTGAGALVLEGRCYEREIVPHKALDGVVDSLSRYLTRLQANEIARLLPENVRALSRLFPVLLRLDTVARAVRKAPGRGEEDASGLRLQAMVALRQLLAKIAEEQPLVLYVDDLQWADAASATLIDELLRPPEAPPVLLVGSFRSEELDEKPFLRDLTAGAGSDACRVIRIGPLSDEAAAELARALLYERSGTERLVERIVHEAGGSPFLVEQLVVYVEVTEAGIESDVGLVEMLSALLQRLPGTAGPFLLTLAVAGRPLEAEIAYAAAGFQGDERPLVGALKAARLVRTSVRASQVELYHSRIRKPLRQALADFSSADSERRVHLRLAELIQERGDDDPEALFAHLLAAGETKAAAAAAMRAASQAAESFSFDRAAYFYRQALELVSPGARPQELAEGLAEALARAGRPHEAARAYLDLAAEADAGDAVGYRQQAAEQLLNGGYFDEGMAVVRQVAEEVGIRIPASDAEAMLTTLVLRMRLRLRGLKFTRREARELDREDLLRLDSYWVVAVTLITTRPLTAAALQGHHLWLALRLGEPVRLARALTFEATRRATVGASAKGAVEELLSLAAELAESVSDPYPQALHHLNSAITSYLMGRWREGAEGFVRTEDFLARHSTGSLWDRRAVWRYGLSCRYYLGELREIRRRVPHLLEAARERGDVQAVTELRTRFHVIHLMDDDAEAVRREIGQALSEWTETGFHLVHFVAMQGLCQAALYDGDTEEAWAQLERPWRTLQRSFLLRIQLSRVEAHHLRGRVGLAAAAAGRREGIPMAEEACRRLRREKADLAGPLALLLEAGIETRGGDEARALELLTRAVKTCEEQELALFAAAGRYRAGELMGGDQGRELVARADGWMREQGVRRPERMVDVLVPGMGKD